MCRLEERKPLEVTDSSPFIHCKVEPGSIIIFPGYLPHEFSLDSGKDSFRFIHWNFQFLPRSIKTVKVIDNFLPKDNFRYKDYSRK